MILHAHCSQFQLFLGGENGSSSFILKRVEFVHVGGYVTLFIEVFFKLEAVQCWIVATSEREHDSIRAPLSVSIIHSATLLETPTHPPAA